MKRRSQGYTLLELLVVISISGVLMVLIGEWMHQTMRFSSSLKQRQHHHQNLTRLERNLRDHVRQSAAIEMEGQNRLLIKTPSEGNVAYEIKESSVRVEARRGDDVISREAYQLDRNSIARWDDSELPDWISLIVTRGPGLPYEASMPEQSSDDREPLVDLNVRVGPNRWEQPLGNSSATGKEQSDD